MQRTRKQASTATTQLPYTELPDSRPALEQLQHEVRGVIAGWSEARRTFEDHVNVYRKELFSKRRVKNRTSGFLLVGDNPPYTLEDHEKARTITHPTELWRDGDIDAKVRPYLDLTKLEHMNMDLGEFWRLLPERCLTPQTWTTGDARTIAEQKEELVRDLLNRIIAKLEVTESDGSKSHERDSVTDDQALSTLRALADADERNKQLSIKKLVKLVEADRKMKCSDHMIRKAKKLLDWPIDKRRQGTTLRRRTLSLETSPVIASRDNSTSEISLNTREQAESQLMAMDRLDEVARDQLLSSLAEGRQTADQVIDTARALMCHKKRARTKTKNMTR